MCVAAPVLGALEYPGANTHFTLDPILLELEGESYVGPILPGPLVDILAGCGPGGGTDDSSGSSKGIGINGDGLGGEAVDQILKVAASRGGCEGAGALQYATVCPVPLGQGEIADLTGEGWSSPTYTAMVFARTGTCAGCVGRNSSVNTFMSLPPQRWCPPLPGRSK